jgi:hypothetical protein
VSRTSGGDAYDVECVMFPDGIVSIKWTQRVGSAGAQTLLGTFLGLLGSSDTSQSEDSLFAAIDMDHDGFLSREEVESALQKNGALLTEDLKAIFDAIDLNHDGKLSRDEFHKAAGRMITRKQ